MGLGWDMGMQTVTIDTRWGVPRYDDYKETETYMLEGRQLTPLAHRGELQDRSEDKVFHTRVEGAFRKIVRHGNRPYNYWWEVIDKNGTRYFYGGLPESGVSHDAVLSPFQGGNIFTWPLVQVRSANGNTIDYTYTQVHDSGTGDGTDGVQGVQLYVKQIRYTGTVGNPGPYSVTFIRDRELEELRRIDSAIDARAGFPDVAGQ